MKRGSVKQKKICLLSGNLSGCGGTQRCTAFLVNELTERNIADVVVIDFTNPTEEVYFKFSEKVITEHIHGKNIIHAIIKLRRILKKYDIDTVINVEAMLGIYSMPAALFLRVKNIIWEHGNFYQKQCRSIDLVRSLELKLCDYYITLTEKDKKNFERSFKGKCKIDFIYNPIEMPEGEIKYVGGKKKILSVGYVREIKGYDYLVDVASIVLKKHPDWIWEIYGDTESNPDYVLSIREKIKGCNLQEKLLLKGITKNIEGCYRNADFLVMTSLMEGLPMTLLEAKAHKLPLVAFDIQTGPDEIITDGINGFLIKPYDIQKMADKICELIEEPELCQEFADNSCIGIEKFDKNEIVNKWMKILG